MQKRIINITPEAGPLVFRKKRVAAYARVSCDKDAMRHSLAAQINYYRDYIERNGDWEFAGIFADEAKTGTKEDREQFQLLLSKCRAGLVDMVVTKSISRFARNTVTLLATVRELKERGIDVYFEEQHIHSLSADGELMLTLMASIAQAESLSCSDNCKWRIRKGFEYGRASTCTMLGYRLVDGVITLIPDEAKVVKEIFDLYLTGFGVQTIADTLNKRGITTEKRRFWYPSAIRKILQNEKYMGDLKLQKTLVLDHLSKKQVPNNGVLPQYYIERDHEPIIDKHSFIAVQEEIVRRVQAHPTGMGSFSVLSGAIRCTICGKNYRRKKTKHNILWCCHTFNTMGKEHCSSKMIPEETLKKAAASVIGLDSFDETAFENQIARIDACPGNLLRFVFRNGLVTERTWQDRSRSESWTEDMRELARKKENNRRRTDD